MEITASIYIYKDVKRFYVYCPALALETSYETEGEALSHMFYRATDMLSSFSSSFEGLIDHLSALGWQFEQGILYEPSYDTLLSTDDRLRYIFEQHEYSRTHLKLEYSPTDTPE